MPSSGPLVPTAPIRVSRRKPRWFGAGGGAGTAPSAGLPAWYPTGSSVAKPVCRPAPSGALFTALYG